MEDLESRHTTGIGFAKGDLYRMRWRRTLYMEMLHHSRAARKARARKRGDEVLEEDKAMLRKQWYFHMALWDSPI